VKGTSGAQFSGTICVTSPEDNCRSLTLNVDVTYTNKEGLSLNRPFEIFYPGIYFKFAGHSCIPDKNKPYTARYSINTKPGEGANMEIKDDMVMIDGPVITKGTISIVVDKGSPVYEFAGSSADTLVLFLTKKGFNHVSGKGSITVPSGKIYKYH
jgi:hypothetical protein